MVHLEACGERSAHTGGNRISSSKSIVTKAMVTLALKGLHRQEILLDVNLSDARMRCTVISREEGNVEEATPLWQPKLAIRVWDDALCSQDVDIGFFFTSHPIHLPQATLYIYRGSLYTSTLGHSTHLQNLRNQIEG
eukprot:3122157-Amphidinium_carterae.1